jgi:hypothetical protein
MSWLILSVATCFVVAISCFIAVRQPLRSRRELAVILSFALPPISYFATFALAFGIGDLAATCNVADCGILEFAAVGLFAVAISTGGGMGAVIGVMGAWAMRKR